MDRMLPKTDKDADIQRIAVVAVHGVGDHLPFDTTRAIGDLLSDLEYQPSNTPRYTPFTEKVQRLNIRPVKVVDREEGFRWSDKESQQRTWGPMDAIAQAAYKKPVESVDKPTQNLDHVFMAGQLAEYKEVGPEDTYQLLRLEGKRLGPPPDAAAPSSAPEKIVHIYEMYWADLTRLSNAFTQIFGELYQVLFHLGSVGVNNVQAASTTFQKSKGVSTKAKRAWKRFDNAQWFVAAILAWPVPILNLFTAALVLPILAVSVMRSHLEASQEFLALDILAGALAVIVCGFLMLRHGKFSLFDFAVPLIVIGAGMAGLGWMGQDLEREWTESLVAALLALLAGGGVALMMRAYSKRRPGSGKVALYLLGALVICFLGAGLLHGWTFTNQPYRAILFCLNLIEVLFALMTVTWTVFFGGLICAHVMGMCAVRAVKPTSDDPVAQFDYERARRTRWTARLVIALPSSLFMVLTLMLWAGVIKVSVPLLPGQENGKPFPAPCASLLEPGAACKGPCCEAVTYASVWQTILANLRKSNPPEPKFASEWVNALMQAAGIGLLPVVLLAMLVAFLIVAWALAPSVFQELKPPHPDCHLAHRASSLGSWLTMGFRFMRVSGVVMYLVMIVLLPAASVLYQVWLCYHPDQQIESALRWTEIAGTLMAGAAVGIFGFRGRLQKVALGFRPAVRAMLDVDSWLREHPRDSNPTARICGRYVSLLRHILAWRDGKHQYDALVIIAHSQGTVITADLLRFLQAEGKAAEGMENYDAELARLNDLPVYLFTMGCPLRQLYGLRFPFLYGWARGPEQGPVTVHKPSDIGAGGADDRPDPDTLGVSQWLNAFRSGDYVGRHLWRSDECSYLWDPMRYSHGDDWDPPAGLPEKISADSKNKRIEFSIGPGAHTHYWDHTGGLIGEVLDRLIDHA